jgi:Ca-activated chloride channel family protein
MRFSIFSLSGLPFSCPNLYPELRLSKFDNELTTLRGGNIFTISYLAPNILADTTDVQTLRSLARKYGLDLFSFTHSPEPSDFTRYEFAATLNNVLYLVNELVAKNSTSVSKADLQTLQKLRGFYSGELAELQKRIDQLEERTRELEQQQFSTTTKLSGEVIFPVNQAPLPNPAPATRPVPSSSTSKTPVAPPPAVNIPTQSLGQARTRQTVPGEPVPPPIAVNPSPAGLSAQDRINPPGTGNGRLAGEWIFHPPNTEDYNPIAENPFLRPGSNPLSTFSIDVDTASYSNVRRFLTQGQLPPKDAVRIEEMINYFPYDYPQPEGNKPFSITTDVAAAPWNPKHKLVQIGLKGRQLQQAQPSNLVFLVDVSGSMDEPNKLPLVKQSLCLLVNELTANDRVTLVVYAGNAGLVLPPTPGDQKQKIIDAIDKLEAGGSTAGGEGIELAYQMAQQNFLKNGNNRVILATDGDFNVGVSSDAELVRLIEQKRDRGIFLTVLGFGTGNYKDAKMEQLADKGNGNYAYIDTLLEAKKVLVNDLRGTLFAIAKDVKIQVEFNPAKVQAYRLIGYENRLLRDQDFNDDTKDAGEIGAGHTVTALYEVIPTGMESDVKLPSIDPLKYQSNPAATTSTSNELMQVKLRYKKPKDSTSQLISQPILDQTIQVNAASNNLKFSAAVVMFGMLLRNSEFKGAANINTILQLANQARGKDQEGYRSEFISLVDRSKSLLAQQKGTENATNNAPQRNRL